MEQKTIRTVSTDVLVIGGGAAGLRAAIEARKRNVDVLIVSKSPVAYKNDSFLGYGTWAAAGFRKDSPDSPEVHFRDTIIAGRSISDHSLVKVMVEGAPQQVRDLTSFGLKINLRDMDMPGHTYLRFVIPEGKGPAQCKTMLEYATKIGAQVKEHVLITKLLKAGNMVVGALGIDDEGQVFVFNAKSTILATGGGGQLYARSINSLGSVGDGYALAYEAGASLRDMELTHYIPTCLGKHGGQTWQRYIWMPLWINRHIAIRNSLGEDIAERYGIRDVFSLNRDQLTRIMMIEITEGRGIEGKLVMDLTNLTERELEELKSTAKAYSRQIGLTEANPKQIFTAPSASSTGGGVKINKNAESTLDGLYAAGEATGGIHGAGKLQGNPIADCLVFGTVAGSSAAARALKTDRITASRSEIDAEVERLNELASHKGEGNLQELRQSLKQVMWDKVGPVRNKKSLEDAQREIAALREEARSVSPITSKHLPDVVRLNNMLTVSEMVCRAALMRTESRGVHYRIDYPEEDNERWLKVIEVSCQSGKMTYNSFEAG